MKTAVGAILLSGFCAAGCQTTTAPSGKKATDPVTRSTPAASGQVIPSAANAWLLVPGTSAGNARINQDAAEVYTALGKPDDGDAAMQHSVVIWYAHHDHKGHSTSIYTTRDTGDNPAARILQIRVTSPTFTTVNGIHVSASLKEIREHFKVLQTDTFTSEGRKYIVYDSPAGIAFETGPDARCTAIIIHRAGQTGTGTYLKFRDYP